MRGSRTPDDVRQAFAAEYLRTGSVRQSCKAAGNLPERTGHEIANELDDDADFAEARRRLHVRALDRAEAAVMRAIDVLSDRIENATELLGNPDEGVKVLDKAADYGRAIANLNDSLLKRRKIEHDMSPDKPQQGPVQIIFTVDEPDSGPDANTGSSPEASG